MRPEVIVIGGGLGGLATAIRLRRGGWPVRLFEKNAQLGGRCNLYRQDGFTFDTGPTLLLMRDALDELFRSAGRDTTEYLDLVRLHPNYCLHFGDGSTLELSTRLDQVVEQVESIEPGAGSGFRRYLDDAGQKYHISRARFVERNFCHWYEFFTPANLRYLLASNALRSLDRHAARYVRDPRLRLALTFQTMYLGLAPHQAPAVYALLPYTEMAEGIWYPQGGMYRVVQALTRLALELGVEIETGAEVISVRRMGRRIEEVVLRDGRVHPAQVVVCNADLSYASQALFGIRRRRPLHPGSSAFLLYLGLDRAYSGLRHHNVYLAADPAENFAAIFQRGKVPDDPSLYVCAPTRTDPSLAPAGCDALYVLVPVPCLNDSIDWSTAGPQLRAQVIERLERSGLDDLGRHIVVEREYRPGDFVSDYNIARGSAFGLSHALHQVGYLRPSNRAPGYDNLYFVGASTIPGGGVPMVLIGSRLTAARVEADHG